MNEDTEKFNVPPWIPMSNPVDIKYLGKLIEELGELTKIASRCLIQGLDGVDPGTGANNRIELEKEIADVYAHLSCNVNHFGLLISNDRIAKKKRNQERWVADLSVPKS